VSSYFKLIIKKTNKKYGNDVGSFKVGLLEVSKEFLDVIDSSTKRIIQNSREIFKPMLVPFEERLPSKRLIRVTGTFQCLYVRRIRIGRAINLTKNYQPQEWNAV
jgi:hypothetical protein